MLHRGFFRPPYARGHGSQPFGFGAFAFAAMLLTHPERLSSNDTLMVDCGGDEYSARGDYSFDRVPLFDFDISRH